MSRTKEQIVRKNLSSIFDETIFNQTLLTSRSNSNYQNLFPLKTEGLTNKKKKKF